MSNSKTVVLGDVATIDRISVQPDNIDSGTMYLGLEDIESWTGRLAPKPVDAGFLASSKFRFTPQHVLYGKLRPYLAKIACPDVAGVCSTDILPILPGPKVDRQYLFQYLRRPEVVAYAAAQAEGANLPRLSPGALAAIELPLPPLADQRRIANLLEKGDALRAKRRATLSLLDSLASVVFLEMFGAHSSRGSEWTTSELKTLIVDGPQNGLYRPLSDYGSGVPILRIDGFYDGAIADLAALKRVDISASEREPFDLIEGDIVINRVNSMEYLGKCALIPKLAEPTVFESNMMRFRVDPLVVHPRFLVQVLQTPELKSQIHSRAKRAVNQASINQQDVGSFRIPVPPLHMQQQFVMRVAAIESVASSASRSAVALDSLFASLQHQGFNGELNLG